MDIEDFEVEVRHRFQALEDRVKPLEDRVGALERRPQGDVLPRADGLPPYRGG
jgi:hypothetical protein